METLGTVLRDCREQSGMSIRELARRVGWYPSSISRFESGEYLPDIPTLRAIVDALHLDQERLDKIRRAIL